MVAGILSEYMVEWILFTCAISELGRTGGGVVDWHTKIHT